MGSGESKAHSKRNTTTSSNPSSHNKQIHTTMTQKRLNAVLCPWDRTAFTKRQSFPNRRRSLDRNFRTLAEVAGGGGYSITFYTASLRPEVQPLTTFIYHFWQERYPFNIPSIDKWYPFHTPSLELCVPSNHWKCTVSTRISDINKSLWTRIFSHFHNHKMYRLALQLRIFLPTEMTDFLSLSVYLKPEKGTTSRRPLWGVQPPGLEDRAWNGSLAFSCSTL